MTLKIDIYLYISRITFSRTSSEKKSASRTSAEKVD